MLLYIYMLLTLAMAGSALWKGAIYPAIAGLVGPTLCWFAASGLKGSLMVGTSRQKLVGMGSAIAFVVVGVGIVYHSGYSVGFFGYEFTGVTWCLVGLVAGWTSTTRKDTVMTTTSVDGERIISKPDADMIFAFTRAEWESYVRQDAPPEGWTVRLLSHDTGTALTWFNQSTGIGASVQPLFKDEQSPPGMIVVGSYYPVGSMRITDELIKDIEQAARLDLGPTYSVSANHSKTPGTNVEGIDLIVIPDTADPRGAKGALDDH